MKKERHEQDRMPAISLTQARIAESIRKENIDQQYAHVMEHTPEVFASVCMLYIKASINGREINVLVDSGAQSTLMSLACAKRVNLAHLIDDRFSGIARGAVAQKVFGRVHITPMKIEETLLSTSVFVIENLSENVDMIFALDMLQRYECCIDLLANRLLIGSSNTSTLFLSEGELCELRARSGCVEPSGTVAPLKQMAASNESAMAPARVSMRQIVDTDADGEVESIVIVHDEE